MGRCRDWPSKYVIYTGPHRVEDHSCGVIRYYKKKGKICIHVIAKYTTYWLNYIANSLWYISRHEANIKTRQDKKVISKKRKQKSQVEKTKEVENVRTKKTSGLEKKEESLLIDIKMKLEGENWVKSATSEFSFHILDKNREHILEYT